MILKKYFDSIDHEILKEKLKQVISDNAVYDLLLMIIDDYEKIIYKGLHWVIKLVSALHYLDGLDRLFRERLRFTRYVRYRDKHLSLLVIDLKKD